MHCRYFSLIIIPIFTSLWIQTRHTQSLVWYSTARAAQQRDTLSPLKHTAFVALTHKDGYYVIHNVIETDQPLYMSAINPDKTITGLTYSTVTKDITINFQGSSLTLLVIQDKFIPLLNCRTSNKLPCAVTVNVNLTKVICKNYINFIVQIIKIKIYYQIRLLL